MYSIYLRIDLIQVFFKFSVATPEAYVSQTIYTTDYSCTLIDYSYQLECRRL